MKTSLPLFSLAAGLVFFLNGHAADMDRKMLEDCKKVADKLKKNNRTFPAINHSSITPLYTWRASVCQTPPTGNGDVTALCDARTARGFPVFFREKKNRHSIHQHFMNCP